MFTAAEKIERQDRILAELSELALALARDLQARALAVDDVAVAADVGRAFHSVSRSARQTLALGAKLDRDRLRQAREDHADTTRTRQAHASRRKAQVKAAVERCIWTEAEGDEAERLLDDLDDRLDLDALADAFAGEDPIDAHIARLCADLGVTARVVVSAGAAVAPSSADDPPRTGAPRNSPDDWRSSA